MNATLLSTFQNGRVAADDLAPLTRGPYVGSWYTRANLSTRRATFEHTYWSNAINDTPCLHVDRCLLEEDSASAHMHEHAQHSVTPLETASVL